MTDRYKGYSRWFAKFLKARDLQDKFAIEFKRQRAFCDQTIMEHLNHADPYNYIFSSFQWHKTDDGCEFWEKAYKDWLKEIK